MSPQQCERTPSPARDVGGAGDTEQVMACLRTDVARWAYQDRLDAGVAADLGHYLQRLQEALDALQDQTMSVTS